MKKKYSKKRIDGLTKHQRYYRDNVILNKEKRNLYARNYYAKFLKVKFEKIREKIAGRPKTEQCELCGILASELKRGLFFDHDHKTGKFRGWLCYRCNIALGMVSDNKELLLKMVGYLSE